MGRKVNWFNAVKKALETKEHQDQRPPKSRKKWFSKKKRPHLIPKPPTAAVETASAATATNVAAALPPAAVLPVEVAKQPPVQHSESVKLKEDESEQNKYAIAIATAKAAEAAAAAAQAAAEVVRLTNAVQSPRNIMEEAAVLRIQTNFRGHLARRALHALQGLARMKCMMEAGQTMTRQSSNTLKSMQTLARVQSQAREMRLGILEENQAHQRHLLETQPKEVKIEEISGDNWNTSAKSREQVDARLQSKHNAIVKRERALAYAFNHQSASLQRTLRSSPTMKQPQARMSDPNNSHSGWSWLERWLAARPWETATDADNPDHATLPTAEIAKAILHRISEKRTSTSSPKSLNSSSPQTLKNQRKSNTSPLKTSNTNNNPSSPRKSVCFRDIDGNGRDSSVGSSDGEDDYESLASSPNDHAIPSYMAATESARAKTRDNKQEVGDRLSISSTKKRTSYPSSPVRSRRSVSSITDAVEQQQQQQCLINGK